MSEIEVLVQVQNPLALPPDEVESFLNDLNSSAVGVEARFAPSQEQRGYAVTWWEPVIIYLAVKLADKVTDKTLDRIVDATFEAFLRWARERFAKQLAEASARSPERKGKRKTAPKRPSLRPKSITIYGPDGEALKAVVIHAPDEEPVDFTEQERRSGPRRLPTPEDPGARPEEE